MENYIISKLKSEFIFWKIIIIHFLNVETESRLWVNSKSFKRLSLTSQKSSQKIIQLIYLLEQFWTSQVTSIDSIQVFLQNADIKVKHMTTC